jgi:Fe-S-cluster containining protein
MQLERPVWRRFVPKFYDRAVAWVRAGGHAVIVHSPARLEMLLTGDALGEPSEQATWAVLSLEQQRIRKVKDGPAIGLHRAMARPHARYAVLDWCDRDSLMEGPTRKLELECLECGACCHDSNVILYEDDIERIRVKKPQFVTSAYIKRSRDGKVRLRFIKRGACQHLQKDLKCRIYELRPFNCSVFPMASEACLAARESTLGLRDGAPAP